MEFKLHSEYQPTGDQPEAIEALTEGFRQGNQAQTLLGVTGSGKTFTLTKRIAYAFESGYLDDIDQVLAITFTRKAARLLSVSSSALAISSLYMPWS